MHLKVDKERFQLMQNREISPTSIHVRALNDTGSWATHDIAVLQKKSLAVWLRSRGGNNPWAESVVAVLLGHDPFTEEDFIPEEEEEIYG